MSKVQERKELLLHSCCGPCSSACIERMAEEYDVTVFYYNPCITDREEYEVRKENQIKLIEAMRGKYPSLDFIEGEYDPEEFLRLTEGLEAEPEGGKRCSVCFEQRLRASAEKAKELGIPRFTTTLTVSPYKNYGKITEIGLKIADEKGLEYVPEDFKKKDGYRRSVELSKEYGLYRQDYCGCVYSVR